MSSLFFTVFFRLTLKNSVIKARLNLMMATKMFLIDHQKLMVTNMLLLGNI